MARAHSLDELTRAAGAPVFDTAGTRIGTVEDIFYDDASGRPEWIGIGTGFLRLKRVLVPVEGASLRDEGLWVPHTADHVKASPDVDGDEITDETERELREHYRPGGDPRPAPSRLRKFVEVSVRREIAHVVREPINRTVDEALIGEAEFELPLRAETPVVRTKETQ